MNSPLFLVSLAAVTLAGCTLAPQYERPAAPVAAAWPEAAPDGGTPPAEIAWRDFFGDARLRRLIDVALDNNRDLRVAVLRVEQARAQYGIQRAGLFPHVSATGSGARQRTPADLSPSGQASTGSRYDVNIGITAFELDLFGRVRSLKEQALEQYLATEEARKSAQLSLVAEVALQYLAERSFAEQMELSRQTLETVQTSAELAQRRYDAGAASELDLRTAEAQVQTARVNVAAFEQRRREAENALAVLLGQPLPSDLPAPQPLAVATLMTDLAAGLPSDLLQRRPDILQAEHLLKAAHANIGAARAAFFPTIRLTAAGGTSSAELDGLFKSGSESWSFAPQISLPLFAGGRNRAALEAAEAGQQIAVATYEKAIQVAFREVADALAARALLDEQLEAQEARVEALEQRYALSDRRYRGGVDNYLTVLLAQQDLFSAQQALIQSRLSRLTNLIALYKALGGGWSEIAREGD